jgi:hypothetical protein
MHRGSVATKLRSFFTITYFPAVEELEYPATETNPGADFKPFELAVL